MECTEKIKICKNKSYKYFKWNKTINDYRLVNLIVDETSIRPSVVNIYYKFIISLWLFYSERNFSNKKGGQNPARILYIFFLKN